MKSKRSEASQCFFCARLHLQTKPKRGLLTCAAYPEGIPQTFFQNEIFHMEPYEGDHGLQFKPREIKGMILPDWLEEKMKEFNK